MTYVRGGMKVARYDSALSLHPTALEFSGEGDLTPVTLIYAEPLAFAKGGLVDTAETIKKAGRYGDTEIIHVNKEELQELRELWGEPTINPQTGCPEYFLKKAWKKIKKIAKPLAQIAPIAAMFIPSVGPLAAAAIGAGSGLLSGGGLKGALLGGAMGGLGASGLAGKAVGALAPGLSPLASRAASSALLGGLGSAATGGNVLKGALTGGALGAAIGPGGIINPQGQPSFGSGPQANGSMSVNAPGISGASDNPFTVQVNGGEIGLPGSSTSGIRTPISVSGSTSNLTVNPPDLSPLMDANPKGLSSYAVDPGKPWLKKPFLGGAISPKISNAVGWGTVGALTLPSLLKSKSSSSNDGIGANMSVQDIVDNKFQSVFSAKLPDAKGMYANLAVRPQRQKSPEEQYQYGYGPENSFFSYVPENTMYAAKGGYADGGEFAVRGDGDGREDLIDAKLSDGEYIIDAETVALLGNGSSKAGAERLDQMRVNIRKHKGRNLAQGRFSVDAKAPEKYMVKKHG